MLLQGRVGLDTQVQYANPCKAPGGRPLTAEQTNLIVALQRVGLPPGTVPAATSAAP
jgi:hypothetical protein